MFARWRDTSNKLCLGFGQERSSLVQEEEDSKDGVGATFSKHVNRQTRGGDGMSTERVDSVFILEVEVTNEFVFTAPAKMSLLLNVALD